MFTDIQGFSAITQEDEQKALEMVARYREVITRQTQSHRGKIVHFFGDGSLSVHVSSVDAVECAIKIQHEFGDNPPIPVRVGIHLGEVVDTGETVYGNAVNIASRLQNLADAHSILISGAVAKELENHQDIKLIFITEEYVKNIKEPIRVHAIVDPGLVTPSETEVHQRGVSKARKSYFALAFILLAAIAYLLFNVFDLFPQDLLDQQILVLPFDNKTGDSTLEDFSHYAAGYISQLMEQEDEIKIVSARDLLEHPSLMAIPSLSYAAISSKTNARNFLDGYFTFDSDKKLVVNAGLVDGRSGNYIKQFAPQIVDPDRPTTGLVQLTESIIGFLISADYKFLSPPSKEAFHAYMEALRLYGVEDYQDSRHYLQDAIRYDSTFIDAYFILCDTYQSTADYAIADSILADIKRRFPIEAMTSGERNSLYFHEAFATGNNVAAYKYLLNEYNLNKKDLYTNTTAATFAMYFLNAPLEAVKILRKIPPASIDYEFPDQQLRLNTGISANFALGRYRQALRFARLYPTRDMNLAEHKLRIRAFAGVGDTAAIQNELAAVKLNFSAKKYVSALYWTAQQFSLLKNDVLRTFYLTWTYNVIVEKDLKTMEKTLALYDMGRYQDGLDQARFLYNYASYYLPYSRDLGRGYALIGKQDSARYYCNKLQELQPGEEYHGLASYLEATVYTAMGDTRTALIKLRNAVDEGFVFKDQNATFDPQLMPLFDNPEFNRIIHPLGEPSWWERLLH